MKARVRFNANNLKRPLSPFDWKCLLWGTTLSLTSVVVMFFAAFFQLQTTHPTMVQWITPMPVLIGIGLMIFVSSKTHWKGSE